MLVKQARLAGPRLRVPASQSQQLVCWSRAVPAVLVWATRGLRGLLVEALLVLVNFQTSAVALRRVRQLLLQAREMLGFSLSIDCFGFMAVAAADLQQAMQLVADWLAVTVVTAHLAVAVVAVAAL